jgi:hypothetical protein
VAAAVERASRALTARDRGKARTLFAGDHLFGDVAASAAFGWRAAAVVQELEDEGGGGVGAPWGSLLCDTRGGRTFWDDFLRREAALVVSDAEALPGLVSGAP